MLLWDRFFNAVLAKLLHNLQMWSAISALISIVIYTCCMLAVVSKMSGSRQKVLKISRGASAP